MHFEQTFCVSVTFLLLTRNNSYNINRTIHCKLPQYSVCSSPAHFLYLKLLALTVLLDCASASTAFNVRVYSMNCNLRSRSRWFRPSTSLLDTSSSHHPFCFDKFK